MPAMRLTELTQLSGVRVDRDAGVIHNVKVIGPVSANRRRYPVEVLAKAAPLYEDTRVNIGHLRDAKTDRHINETFGSLRAISVKSAGENQGLYGDLHCIKSHPLFEQVCEMAEKFPNRLGLSHDADGKATKTADGLLVESIEKVNSVDLVPEPATNKSLFESIEPMKLRTLKISEMIGTLPTDSSQKKLLTKLVEEDAVSGDTSVSTSETASPEQAIKAAFLAEIVKAVEDESLDFKATLAKIKDLLKAQEKVMDAMASTKPKEEGAPASSTDAPSDQSPAMESLIAKIGKLQEQVAAMTTSSDVDAQLRESKKTVSPEAYKALCAIPDKAGRQALIESIGSTAGGTNGQKPRTTGAKAATTTAAGGELPKGDKFVESIRRPAPVFNLGN